MPTGNYTHMGHIWVDQFCSDQDNLWMCFRIKVENIRFQVLWSFYGESTYPKSHLRAKIWIDVWWKQGESDCPIPQWISPCTASLKSSQYVTTQLLFTCLKSQLVSHIPDQVVIVLKPFSQRLAEWWTREGHFLIMHCDWLIVSDMIDIAWYKALKGTLKLTRASYQLWTCSLLTRALVNPFQIDLEIQKHFRSLQAPGSDEVFWISGKVFSFKVM